MTSDMHKESRLAIPFAPSIEDSPGSSSHYSFRSDRLRSLNPPTLLLHYLYL